MDPCNNTESLQEYIKQCKTRLQKILQRLDWSEEGVLKNFNTNSLASSTTPKSKKIGSPKVSTYPDSCVTKNSIVIETPQLQKLLQNEQIEAPQNFRDLQANFSREQKLIIYEHVTEHTEKLENNTVPKVAEGEISLAEIVAQKKREEKRKKRKFRKSKPTHIEEVRCLVDLQMQALQQFMGNKINQTERDKKKDKGREYNKSRTSRSREGNKEIAYKSYIRNGSRSNEKFGESRRRSKSRSIGRSNEFKIHKRSPYCERRKRSISRDWDTDRELYRSKKVENYRSKRSRSRSPDESIGILKNYEKYHRRLSKSPKRASSRDKQTSERSRKRNIDTNFYRIKETEHHQKFSNRRSPNESAQRWKDYEETQRRQNKSPQISTSKDRPPSKSFNHKIKSYDYDSKSRRRSKSREGGHYSKEEKIEKYYEKTEKSYRKHFEDRDDKKSRHKSKKHKRDRS